MKKKPLSLNGSFLIATPQLHGSAFEKAVIYLCDHSESHAMGIVINHPMTNISMTDILEQLNIPCDIQANRNHHIVVKGGPVDSDRGFVIHSDDYHIDGATLSAKNGISMTGTKDVLEAIARQEGPKQSLLALGYAGWKEGQLEREIQQSAWLFAPADPDFIFDPNPKKKWQKCLSKIGVDPAWLSLETGRA